MYIYTIVANIYFPIMSIMHHINASWQRYIFQLYSEHEIKFKGFNFIAKFEDAKGVIISPKSKNQKKNHR